MTRNHSLNWINRPIHRDKIEARFIKKHERSLANVARSIEALEEEYSHETESTGSTEQEDDFFVLSLTRTGPRIIELIELGDIEYDDLEIISEKSLDFMPSSSVEGSNVALFDDIAVTGQTVSQMKSYLQNEYNMNVYPILLAIDGEEISISQDNLNYQLKLDPGKRFQFIHEMVNSFAFLNKPYDVDHAIFYSEIGPDQRNVFESIDDCYDLTTPYQAEHGFRRYSIIPGELDRTFLDSNVFVQGIGDTQIEKLRIYYDEQTGAVRYVPISIFSLHKKEARSRAIFSPTYEEYNELLSIGHKYLDTNRPSMAMFRLIWYLRSVITGQQYFQEYLTDIDENLSGNPLGESLNHRDLSILFGPDFAWEIRSELYNKQLATKRLSHTGFGQQQNAAGDSSSNQEYLPPDENQREVIEDITPYIEANLNQHSSLSEQVATVFEAFHMEVERGEIERYGGQTRGDYRKERDLGLSYPQIRKLLEDNEINLDGMNTEIEFSRTFDFLIDSGIQVPIFYEQNDILERAYRHGEGVLNNTRYAYLINSVADEVFSEVNNISDRRSLSKVTFEKIGFLIGDKLDNNEYWAQTATDVLSRLRKPLPDTGFSKRIRVSPGVHRHGRIQLIDPVGEVGGESLFTQWASEEGIIQEHSEQGVRKSGEWENTSKVKQKIVPDEMLYDFEAIGICCAHINKEIGNDPLVAITTCRTEGEFVNAARKEIELVMEKGRYSIIKSIEDLEETVKDREELLETAIVDLNTSSLINSVDDAIAQSRKSKQAVSDIGQKHNYWENLNMYISEIDTLFSEGDRHLNGIYRSSIKTYLDNLRQERNDSTDRSDFIREQTLHTGRLLKGLSQLLIDLGLTAKSILEQKNIRPALSSLFNSVSEWNRLVEGSTPGEGSNKFANLTKIDFGEADPPQLREKSKHPDDFRDKVLALKIINSTLPRIKNQLNVIEDVYNHTFQADEWSERHQTFYPDSNNPTIEDINSSWALWYDMKNSTSPDNEEASERLKEYLNGQFKNIEEDRGDLHFQHSMDDSKHLFAQSSETLIQCLRTLLRNSNDAGIVNRIGVCRIRPNELTRNVESGSYNSELAHRLSKRLGNSVEKFEHISESDQGHTLNISEDVLIDVFDDEPANILTQWRITQQADRMISYQGIPRRIKTHSFDIEMPDHTDE